MNFNNLVKSVNKNYLLLFLIVLVGFVLVDCNTKMFSKLMEGQSCGSGANNGVNVVSSNGSNGCGRGCDGKNPTGCASGNCNSGAVNKLNSNSNSKNGKPVVQGFVEDQKMYVSASGPYGREVPKTLQGDYSTLKSFGLTNLKDVVNYIPGDGPSQFVKGNTNNNNAAGRRNTNVNRNANVNKNANVNRNNNNNTCKPIVYGADWCGWTKKQKKYMEDNKIDYTYIDCAKDKDACPAEVKGFPAIKHCDGTLKPGYQEL
jgi:hypothetical protein